jgi:hypothetical protein
VVSSVELLARRELFSLCVDALVVIDVARTEVNVSACLNCGFNYSAAICSLLPAIQEEQGTKREGKSDK